MSFEEKLGDRTPEGLEILAEKQAEIGFTDPAGNQADGYVPARDKAAAKYLAEGVLDVISTHPFNLVLTGETADGNRISVTIEHEFPHGVQKNRVFRVTALEIR